MIKEFEIEIDGKTLKAKSLGDIAQSPSFLFLQGGSKSSDIFSYLSKKLLEKNINSLLFDHSGFGNSEGNAKNSSLKVRTDEAYQISKSICKPLNLCAFSMGGYISLKLLEKVQVKTLILFCPGIYDQKAYNINFGPAFSEVIREKESWRNSDIFEPLKQFTGNLLIIIGDRDEVIPAEVISLLDENSQKCQKKEIIFLPNCTHAINEYLQNNEEKLNLVVQKISEFI